MTVSEALRVGAKSLRTHRCDGADPVREAEALLSLASGLTRERMLLAPERPLSPAARRKFAALVARRRGHAPLAYLLGTAWFAGAEFAVDRRTLIPRPATEIVFAAALWRAADRGAKLAVDVGTGSGCIAAAAALALPDAKVIATDDAAGPLAVARGNARRLDVAGRVFFAKGDLLAPAAGALAAAHGPALIIANLPYVPAGRKASPCVRREPRRAVFAPGDGTGPYRRLFAQLAALRRRPALTLACELLPSQYAPLRSALRRLFPDATVAPIKNHQHRIVGLLADI